MTYVILKRGWGEGVGGVLTLVYFYVLTHISGGAAGGSGGTSSINSSCCCCCCHSYSCKSVWKVQSLFQFIFKPMFWTQPVLSSANSKMALERFDSHQMANDLRILVCVCVCFFFIPSTFYTVKSLENDMLVIQLLVSSLCFHI